MRAPHTEQPARPSPFLPCLLTFSLTFLFPFSSSAETAQQLLTQALTQFKKGNFETCEITITRFLHDYGTLPEAQPLLIKALPILALSQSHQNKFAEAFLSIEKALSHSPPEPFEKTLRFWHGITAFHSNQKEKALPALKFYLKKYPDDPLNSRIIFYQALCLHQLSHHQELKSFLDQKNKKLTPHHLNHIALLRLENLIQNKNYPQAIEILNTIDPRSPHFSQIIHLNNLTLKLSNQLLQENRLKLALKTLQKVWDSSRIKTWQKKKIKELTTSTQHSEPPQTLHSIQQLQTALAEFDKATTWDKSLHTRIAHTYYRLGHYRHAYLRLKNLSPKTKKQHTDLSHHYYTLLCLAKMNRWNELTSESQYIIKKASPENPPFLSDINYLTGEAHQRLKNHSQAIQFYQKVYLNSPESPHAERCYFLTGYNLLAQNKYSEAIAHFNQHEAHYGPKSPLLQKSHYWHAMSLFFDHQYPEAHQAFTRFLNRWQKSPLEDAVTFRRAHTLYLMKKFTQSYRELFTFTEKFPHSHLIHEAHALLGDNYFTLGEIDLGLTTYQKIPLEQNRLYDYANFRIATAYQKLEDDRKLETHLLTFIEKRSSSPRLPEALARLAKLYHKENQPQKAQSIYWQALESHGNNPEAHGIESILTTLIRQQKTPTDRQTFLTNLNLRITQTAPEKSPTLYARYLWASAQLMTNQAEKEKILKNIVTEKTNFTHLSPKLLIDIGDAHRLSGNLDTAFKSYHTLERWWPRSRLHPHALAGKAFLALARKDEEKALFYFSQIEKKSPPPSLWAEILQARTSIHLKNGNTQAATQDLESILSIKEVKGELHVKALFQIGEIYKNQQDFRRAIPYYQRIYILYTRWDTYVAKSYLSSAEAFEQLGMNQEAQNTYHELLSKKYLQKTPEYQTALRNYTPNPKHESF